MPPDADASFVDESSESQLGASNIDEKQPSSQPSSEDTAVANEGEEEVVRTVHGLKVGIAGTSTIVGCRRAMTDRV